MSRNSAYLTGLLKERGLVLEFKQNSLLNATYNATDGNRKDLLKLAADYLGKEIVKTRKIVTEGYLPFVEYLNRNRPKAEDTKELLKYDIVVYEIPRIVPMLVDAQAISLVSGMPILPMSTLYLPLPDDVIGALKNSDALFNDAIMDIASKYTVDELKDIWYAYMYNISGSNYNLQNLSLNTLSNLETAIILYAWVDRLQGEDMPVNANVDELTYKTTIAQLGSLLASIIANKYNRYLSAINIDMVIDRIQDNTAYVIAPVYNKYLEEGGSPEAIIGAMINSDTVAVYNKVTLLEHNKQLLDNVNAVIENTRSYNLRNMDKIYMAFYYMSIPNAIIPIELNSGDIDASVGATAYAKYGDDLNKILSTLPLDKITDIEYVALLLYGKVIYKDTIVYNMVSDMLDIEKVAAKEGMDITIDAAARYASTNAVVDYLVSQVNLCTNTAL